MEKGVIFANVKSNPINEYELLIAYQKDKPLTAEFFAEYSNISIRMDLDRVGYSKLTIGEIIRELLERNDESGAFIMPDYDSLFIKTDIGEIVAK